MYFSKWFSHSRLGGSHVMVPWKSVTFPLCSHPFGPRNASTSRGFQYMVFCWVSSSLPQVCSWSVMFQRWIIISASQTFSKFFFPKQCGNTWGSYGNSKKPGGLDRGGGRVARGIHRYFRGFALASSFRLWIFVVFGVAAPTPAGFVCKFS